jgi:hypothetical protein
MLPLRSRGNGECPDILGLTDFVEAGSWPGSMIKTFRLFIPPERAPLDAAQARSIGRLASTSCLGGLKSISADCKWRPIAHEGRASTRKQPVGQISVYPLAQKYFASPVGQITDLTPRVSSHRGAYRDRHGRGMGCGGRGSVRRAT